MGPYFGLQQRYMDEDADSGESDGDEIDSEESGFRQDFQTCLETLEHTGTFASFATTSSYVSPGLRVEKVGSIGLPLSTRDAQAIAAVCKQAPFGRKDETIVDEAVRKTWELDGTEFTCSNPLWSAYVDQLTQQALATLGVQVSAQAQQYKLLLYEEGAFFKPHRDTEKVPGMFGTLVVCLPSLHTGGEVVLIHGGRTRTIETAETSAFNLAALAWYSDVQHEICPVRSGYRLVLTYNLVQTQTSSSIPNAAELRSNEAQVEKYLRLWINDFPRQAYYIWPLEHQYTQSSLSLRQLKGHDTTRCRALERWCSQNGVWWFLSMMTRTRREDEDYGEDDEDAVTLTETFTPSGQSISLFLDDPQHEQILTDVDAYYDRDADSEDEGGFTGNEGMPSTQRYHNTVAIMVKKDHVITSILNKKHNCDSLTQLYVLIKEDPDIQIDQRRLGLANLLKSALKTLSSPDDFQNPYVYSMYRPVDARNDRDMRLAEYIQLVSDYCHLIGEQSVVSEVLQAEVRNKTWTKSKPLLDFLARVVAKDIASEQDRSWDKWLSVPLPTTPTYKSVNNRRILFEAVKGALPIDAVPSFHQKMQQELDGYVRAVASVRENDIEPLIRLMMGSILPKTYLEIVLPTLINTSNSSILSNFLQSVGAQEHPSESYPADILRLTLERIVPELAPKWTLSIDQLTTPREHSHDHMLRCHTLPQPEQLEISARAKEMLGIIQKCIESGLPGEAEQFLTAALPDVNTISYQAWTTRWKSMFLFIQHLLELLHKQQDARLNAIGSVFITKSIQAAATNLARSQPLQPRDWSQPHVQRKDCSCPPCQEVTTFLLNSHQTTGHFSYAQQTRRHIEDSFGYPRSDFVFSTEIRGSPHTLVIQKTTNKYNRQMSAWQQTMSDMQSGLIALRSNFVSELLGHDILAIPGLDNALRSYDVPGAARQPLASSSASTRNVIVAGTKRKINHVVDLTED